MPIVQLVTYVILLVLSISVNIFYRVIKPEDVLSNVQSSAFVVITLLLLTFLWNFIRAPFQIDWEQKEKISQLEKQKPSVVINKQSEPLEVSDKKVSQKLNLRPLQFVVTNNRTGGRLEGATCIAENEDTNIEYSALTRSSGIIEINIPYGLYTVTVKSEDYGTHIEAVEVDETHGDVSVGLRKL
jgi:hypothetical protein